jgi:site-specific recombinase XerD
MSSSHLPAGVAHHAVALPDLDTLGEMADALDAYALAANTSRGYDARWAEFERWCARHGRAPLPAEPGDVRLYLVDLASQIRPDGTPRLKASSIGQHLAAISRRHTEAGFAAHYGGSLARHPLVATAYAGLRRLRQEGRNPRRPLLTEDVATLCRHLPIGLPRGEEARWPAAIAGARDHLALLLGFGAAMRRSETAALLGAETWVEHHALLDPTVDVAPGSDASAGGAPVLYVRVARAKNDQEGLGSLRAIPRGSRVETCAPCAWIRWTALLGAPDDVDRSGRTEETVLRDRMRVVFALDPAPGFDGHLCGQARATRLPSPAAQLPLLRRVNKAGAISDEGITGSALGRMVERRLTQAGYDPAHYGTHSLRAGFVTQSRRNGADHRSVRRQTGQKTDAMVEVYDRDWNPLNDNAVFDLGL